MSLTKEFAQSLAASLLGNGHTVIFIIAEPSHSGPNSLVPAQVVSASPKPSLISEAPMDAKWLNPDDSVTPAVVTALVDRGPKPNVTSIVKACFMVNATMTTKQVFDALINSGNMGQLEEYFGEESAHEHVKQTLYIMKQDGFLTRINAQKNTPWVATEKLLNSKDKSGSLDQTINIADGTNRKEVD